MRGPGSLDWTRHQAPQTARACPKTVSVTGAKRSIRLGRVVGPIMVQAGATLTIYASTTHPTYFRPASLGCVLWTRLDSQTGMRVAAIALLRTGWADIFNRVEQGPYAGGAQLSEGIVVHIVR